MRRIAQILQEASRYGQGVPAKQRMTAMKAWLRNQSRALLEAAMADLEDLSPDFEAPIKKAEAPINELDKVFDEKLKSTKKKTAKKKSTPKE